MLARNNIYKLKNLLNLKGINYDYIVNRENDYKEIALYIGGNTISILCADYVDGYSNGLLEYSSDYLGNISCDYINCFKNILKEVSQYERTKKYRDIKKVGS